MAVYIFLAEGFEEIEAIAPIDILRRAEIETVTISVSETKTVIGSHNIPIIADKLFDEVDFRYADALVLPGGLPGTYNLEAHTGLKELILKHYNEGKLLSSICAAPSILGKLGILESKRAIAYPGFEKFLEGAIISDKKVVVDGKILTAKAAGVAIEFALELVSILKGKEIANKIQSGIFL